MVVAGYAAPHTLRMLSIAFSASVPSPDKMFMLSSAVGAPRCLRDTVARAVTTSSPAADAATPARHEMPTRLRAAPAVDPAPRPRAAASAPGISCSGSLYFHPQKKQSPAKIGRVVFSGPNHQIHSASSLRHLCRLSKLISDQHTHGWRDDVGRGGTSRVGGQPRL